MERKDVLIPAADIERQREFTQKIRALHEAREAHPTACVDTFGCQQNVAAGQQLIGRNLLHEKGPPWMGLLV